MTFAYASSVPHSWVRLVRANLAWLHAQFQLLTHLVEFSPLDHSGHSLQEITRVTHELQKAKREIDAHYVALTDFGRLLEHFHGGLLDRVKKRLQAPDFPRDLAKMLADVLRPTSAKTFAVTQSITNQLQQISNDKIASIVSQIATLESSIQQLELQIARHQPTPPVSLLQNKRHLEQELVLRYAALEDAKKEASGNVSC